MDGIYLSSFIYTDPVILKVRVLPTFFRLAHQHSSCNRLDWTTSDLPFLSVSSKIFSCKVLRTLCSFTSQAQSSLSALHSSLHSQVTSWFRSWGQTLHHSQVIKPQQALIVYRNGHIWKCICNIHVSGNLRLLLLHINKPGGLIMFVILENLDFTALCLFPQECPGTQELQNSLHQAQKLLASHEASYLQSLRSLKRKISQLQNSTARAPSRSGYGESFWWLASIFWKINIM